MNFWREDARFPFKKRRKFHEKPNVFLEWKDQNYRKRHTLALKKRLPKFLRWKSKTAKKGQHSPPLRSVCGVKSCKQITKKITRKKHKKTQKKAQRARSARSALPTFTAGGARGARMQILHTEVSKRGWFVSNSHAQRCRTHTHRGVELTHRGVELTHRCVLGSSHQQGISQSLNHRWSRARVKIRQFQRRPEIKIFRNQPKSRMLDLDALRRVLKLIKNAHWFLFFSSFHYTGALRPKWSVTRAFE